MYLLRFHYSLLRELSEQKDPADFNQVVLEYGYPKLRQLEKYKLVRVEYHGHQQRVVVTDAGRSLLQRVN